MAEDIWTVNLECDGADPGNEFVQREMDRDVLSFFDLFALIEEYGYTSIDYLYYKRRNGGTMASLVAIETDFDVTKMIEENESEKKVSLFVTRQKVNANRQVRISPTKSNKGLAPIKAKGKKGRKKKLIVIETRAQYANEPEHQGDGIQDNPGGNNEVNKRGQTVLPHVWDLPDGRKIVVRCNQLGQPIGEEGGLLGQFLGTVARNGGYYPLNINDWRKVKKDGGSETMLQVVQTKFLYPCSCEKWILKSIGRDWRRYKAALKQTFFNPKKKRSALYKLCPEDVDKSQWVALVKDWKSEKGKALSERNKISRQMKKTTHTAGTKSYARWAEDLRQDDPEKKTPHRAKVYLVTHKTTTEDKNKPAVQLESLIGQQPELAQNNDGKVAWKGDALHQVLGEEKPGQVHGLGLLPVPKQVYGQMSRHFKNINVVTVDGSSSEVDTHILEEIKQIKEHSRKQDQVIEKLLDKEAHNENRESAMVNCHAPGISNDHEQVVHSGRKRVQCNQPHQEDLLSEHRDEMNKERIEARDNMSENDDMFWSNKEYHDDANYKKLSQEEAEQSSSPCLVDVSGQQKLGKRKRNSHDGKTEKGKMSKKHHEVIHEPTSMTQVEATHDNITSLKKSKKTRPSPFKVGTTVLLKTAKYPNKAVVAYATFVSSSPKAKVDGVEIGNQFMKVLINHPTAENKPLVRPMGRLNLIGDAHAKGVPIAWPSLCVEMING